MGCVHEPVGGTGLAVNGRVPPSLERALGNLLGHERVKLQRGSGSRANLVKELNLEHHLMCARHLVHLHRRLQNSLSRYADLLSLQTTNTEVASASATVVVLRLAVHAVKRAGETKRGAVEELLPHLERKQERTRSRQGGAPSGQATAAKSQGVLELPHHLTGQLGAEERIRWKRKCRHLHVINLFPEIDDSGRRRGNCVQHRKDGENRSCGIRYVRNALAIAQLAAQGGENTPQSRATLHGSERRESLSRVSSLFRGEDRGATRARGRRRKGLSLGRDAVFQGMSALPEAGRADAAALTVLVSITLLVPFCCG